MEARTLQAHKPNEPFKMIAPGKVYRCDYDATHSPIFHQMEGMIVDKNIRFSDLKKASWKIFFMICSVLTRVSVSVPAISVHRTERGSGYFLCHVRRKRMPGLLSYRLAGNPGLRRDGWEELRLNGYDPKQVNAFAFGMGVERIAMLKYGIDDLRLFYENDMRFLNQF